MLQTNVVLLCFCIMGPFLLILVILNTICHNILNRKFLFSVVFEQ